MGPAPVFSYAAPYWLLMSWAVADCEPPWLPRLLVFALPQPATTTARAPAHTFSAALRGGSWPLVIVRSFRGFENRPRTAFPSRHQ